MDEEAIKALKDILSKVAAQARQDALDGTSNIGSIFDDEPIQLYQLDADKIEQTIADIDKATATKEGARRLINGIMIAAKVAAKALPA